MKFTVYDFDKTIYDGDSSIDFIKFCIKKKKRLIFLLPSMVIAFIKNKNKKITKEEMKESFFQILTKFDSIDEIIKEFWIEHENKLKAFFINKKTHKNDIIASASPIFLIEPIAKKYKVKDLFASPIDKKSGKYYGKNCHGVEKVKLINKKYPNCIVYEMYSDDIKADKPLLDLAENSYVVCKNEIIDYKKYIQKNKNKSIKDLYKKHNEIINYLIIGVLTTLISLLIYYICVFTFLNPQKPLELQIANIISWIGAVLFAYITNRKIVFKSKNTKIKKEMTEFIGSRIITLILDMLTMFILVTLLNINDKIAKLIVQFLVIIGNYIISKFFVFKIKK